MQHTFIEILRRALDEELARDPAVHLLGEDVAAGGAFGVTRGLAQKHGSTRVRNTPISEAAITRFPWWYARRRAPRAEPRRNTRRAWRPGSSTCRGSLWSRLRPPPRLM